MAIFVVKVENKKPEASIKSTSGYTHFYTCSGKCQEAGEPIHLFTALQADVEVVLSGEGDTKGKNAREQRSENKSHFKLFTKVDLGINVKNVKI